MLLNFTDKTKVKGKTKMVIEKNCNDYDFEKGGDNIAKVCVYDKSGNDITKDCTVTFHLNKNALIGFGSSAICLANNFEVGRHSHIEPMTKENIVQDMGIVLTPDSSELIVICADLGNFDAYRKKS